jgi:hypothetical protein
MFRIVTHDRLGRPLGELDRATNVSRSYALSKSTQLTFDVSLSDPKCTAELLRFNNIIIVYSDVWPTWSGFIKARTWSEDTLTITCDSIENRFQKRLTDDYEELEDEQAGDIFYMLLTDANRIDPTGIVAGTVFNGGTPLTMTISREVVYNKLQELVEASKLEWRVNIVSTGAWQMDFLERIGRDLTSDIVVVQGLDMAGPPDLQEDGTDYANSVIAVGTDEELDAEDQPEAEYTDWEAAGREGLAQAVVTFDSEDDEGVLSELARKEVWKLRAPKRTLSFALTNRRGIWGQFDVGDYICVVLPYYGFTGMVVPLRVTGIEVSEDQDIVTVAGEVVVGEEVLSLDMYKNAQWGFNEEYISPPSIAP